jgi:hypothetical protein
LQILLAVAFITAAGFKLSGASIMVAEFGQIGRGKGFRYLTAAVAISGALALLAPRVTILGGL